MVVNKKTTFTKAEFLTPTQFGKKYDIPNQLVLQAFLALDKKRKCGKTYTGNLTSIIVKNRSSHNKMSGYFAHPLFHDVVLEEIDKQRPLFLNKQKGSSNEI